VTPAPHQWIDQADQLARLVAEIEHKIARKEVSACFVDTEADSLHHFQEKLCLIQLAVGGTYALIDTLALPDVSSLLATLDKLEVWMHGADYDLTLLKRTYGWTPKRGRDTQIAARLVGHRQFGLAALILKHFDVTLSKASQKADWSKRPLPEKMLIYAVDDVRYLGPLVDILNKELVAKHRLDWFLQSCESLRADVLNRQERGREDAWRISGSGALRPKGLALLRGIWLWRDGMARERDVPPFRIMNNQQMLTAAMEFEKGDEVKISPRWRGKWRDTFVDVLKEVRSSDSATWPQRLRGNGKRATDEQRAAIEQLCKKRDAIAANMDIESSLIGSRADLEAMILRPAEPDAPHLMKWQRELLDKAEA
jgi:ribonuclease D